MENLEDEEESAYYDEFEGEFQDNEEDADAVGVVKRAPERTAKDRERLREFCARVQASGERAVSAADIAALYDFQFDKFQVFCALALPVLQVPLLSSFM